jgi:hypothetical protein
VGESLFPADPLRTAALVGGAVATLTGTHLGRHGLADPCSTALGHALVSSSDSGGSNCFQIGSPSEHALVRFQTERTAWRSTWSDERGF